MSNRYSPKTWILPSVLPVLILQGFCCAPVVDYIATAKQVGNPNEGITYYVGGAGPIGHVGSWDVPRGLAEAEYPGLVEIFTWQGMTHAGDQINLSRNRTKAIELAARVKAYRRRHPDQPINVIALSAGTGIATFALEYLPEGVRINRVIFLGCSLSSTYDMTRVLRRIDGGLYVVYSPFDRILRNVVWYTGTVDRNSAAEGVAGLEGFHLPAEIAPDTLAHYDKLHNVPYRREFEDAGYGGGHTDCTGQTFVGWYLAPVLADDDRVLLGNDAEGDEASPEDTPPEPTTQPIEELIRYPQPEDATSKPSQDPA